MHNGIPFFIADEGICENDREEPMIESTSSAGIVSTAASHGAQTAESPSAAADCGPSPSYKGKVALVSGGSSGIGLGIAKHLAHLGARVFILGRSQEKLDTAVAEIGQLGGTVASYSADVRDAAKVAESLAQCKAQYGPIDVVIAAAAGNFFCAAGKLTPNGFKAVVDIDLIGTFNVFSAAFPLLRRPGAALLAITAPQAQRPWENQAHVCAAKAGIDMLVKCLALEWGKLGVRVNAVSPGPISGTEGLRRLSTSPEIDSAVRDSTSLGRFGEVGDIARAVAFLCSPLAGYITGTILDCDGGMRLGNLVTL
jgi:NAD(P)-dependent dehydrogenase (short-subunit alcohol dehydrogenase family)